MGLGFMIFMMFMMFRRGGRTGMCGLMSRDDSEDLKRQIDELKEEVRRLKKTVMKGGWPWRRKKGGAWVPT
jgi:hypothetical protein